MNRSKTLFAKCFVPSCTNTTSNSRKKVFVLVREDVKKRWCQDLNIKYQPAQRLYCCEDHLDLELDLENYQYWKFTKKRPKLKSTAMLRRMQDIPSFSQNDSETSGSDSNSTLKALLLQPVEKIPKVKTRQQKNPETQQVTGITDCNTSIIRPTVTSASTHTVKIDAGTQYFVNTNNKYTSTADLLIGKKMLSNAATQSSVNKKDKNTSTEDLLIDN